MPYGLYVKHLVSTLLHVGGHSLRSSQWCPCLEYHMHPNRCDSSQTLPRLRWRQREQIDYNGSRDLHLVLNFRLGINQFLDQGNGNDSRSGGDDEDYEGDMEDGVTGGEGGDGRNRVTGVTG